MTGRLTDGFLPPPSPLLSPLSLSSAFPPFSSSLPAQPPSPSSSSAPPSHLGVEVLVFRDGTQPSSHPPVFLFRISSPWARMEEMCARDGCETH
eukprot:552295-Rhodomonas_salina.1